MVISELVPALAKSGETPEMITFEDITEILVSFFLVCMFSPELFDPA